MIERIIEFSIRNRIMVLLVTAGLAIAGVFAALNTPVDAIPDLSENQVIVFTDWMGRSPQEIEDQVTYPLSSELQGLAGIRAIRSSSEFNFSMITIIFDDNIDFYFARQRVTEKLSEASTYLPQGVSPYLAPDATALGQIFWYTVEPSKEHPVDPGRLWAVNKFYISRQLNSVAGVADVATVGGAPLEYQVDVRPEELRAYGITLGELYSAVSKSNQPSGGGVVQKNNAEYIVRGVGWIQNTSDIENTVIKQVGGTPIYVKNVATVQLGTQFRRSVFEKSGSEVTGGAVLMRQGENPLVVTKRVKEKIAELQPGLPAGVHIVPAYDRTRLITGAIETLRDVMMHEMLIASIAILLILMHVRSVFVICVTLPLAVLFSFLTMWVLRTLHIVDIQANIMSLAGITISIGILVDQAIVMTENATHHLKEHFGDRKVTGNIAELIIEPCRTVGRPIFFSVMIMLLSFVPVFMLSGRVGKLFHPLAFTKSFAVVGVAIISITVVPALIPFLIKGRLRSEDENPIVRSFIQIYKPLLTWALPRRNLVMWAFGALLILAAGMFPLQALFGLGASYPIWKIFFLIVFAVVTFVTVISTLGLRWKALSFVTLVLLGLWAHTFPKIGVAFMPPLDEGGIMDMPVTVPRASVTQTADDLKARDALLRGFPEVESVIGKSGRADTPTDPAPLDMVETFVNFRPRPLWPKRVLLYADAENHVAGSLAAMEKAGFLPTIPEDKRKSLLTDATQKALERFDESMRDEALADYQAFGKDSEAELVHYAVQLLVKRWETRGDLKWTAEVGRAQTFAAIVDQMTRRHGPWLAEHPALEESTQLIHDVAEELHRLGVLTDVAGALDLKPSPVARGLNALSGFIGMEPTSLDRELLAEIEAHRTEIWEKHVTHLNWELFDHGTETFAGLALEELAKGAEATGVLTDASKAAETKAFAEAAVNGQLGKPADPKAREPFSAIKADRLAYLRDHVFLWQRHTGRKGDLVDDEMGRVLQVPGWTNIFTQPIANRIDMLSTGVRTDIGVKVFGPDIATIDRVCKDVETALKPIEGASGVLAAPVQGKGYLQIDIDRTRAARYGISVEAIQNEIEVALGGRAVTYTVEERNRFPVRIRYARVDRDDETSIGRLLVSTEGPAIAAGMGQATGPSMAESATTMPSGKQVVPTGTEGHTVPRHSLPGGKAVPLSAVANIRVVEGPAMIKSENGRLMNVVTLSVRDRDIVGFVEEAQRRVGQNVKLPEGVHIEWSGEFEHQVRAARTLMFVFPIVIVLIFLILYFTYKDFADAVLMMLAVPEALAGGAFFMFLFPKIMDGWAAKPMDFSVAVWVGFIACFGMATETGIIMLVYLREAIEKRGGLENIKSLDELRQAVIEGAAHRLRPKLLTEGVAIVAIFPMVFAKGVGGEILAPMALPVLGGLLISDEVVDLFLPVRFYWVRRQRWLKLQADRAAKQAADETASADASSGQTVSVG